MSGIRDLHLGRLALPTVQTPLTEQLGSQVDSVGDASAVGQRRAKGFTLVFPIHGTPGDVDWTAAGNRMRRQLRSLIQNHPYRLSGLYMNLTLDPERNGWLVVGEAELADNNGGVPFGDYLLTISQAFLVAQRHLQQEAYQFDVTDLRASSAIVDYFGEQVGLGAGFAGLSTLPLAFVPPGATDAVMLNAPIALKQRRSASGLVGVRANVADGDTLSFDRDEAHLNTADVVLLDRRGNVNGTAKSTSGVALTTVWRNLHPNPRAAVGMLNINAAGASAAITRRSDDGYQGSTCFQLDAPTPAGSVPELFTAYQPADPGELVYVRCAVKAVTTLPAGAWIELDMIQSNNGAFVTSWACDAQHAVTSGKWIVLEGFSTVHPQANQIGVAVTVQNVGTTASTVRIADIQMTAQHTPPLPGEPAGWPPYVAGDQPGCQWLGQAHNSVSIGPVQRTNLVTNPNAETDTSGWTASTSGGASATVARTTSLPLSGTNSFQLTGSIPGGGNATVATAGMPVYGGHEYVATLQTDLYSGSGWTANLVFYDSTGGQIADTTAVAAVPAGVGSVTVVKAAPRAARTCVLVLSSSATQSGYLLIWDSVLVQLTDPASPPPPTRVLRRGFNGNDWTSLPGSISYQRQIQLLQQLGNAAFRLPMPISNAVRPSAGAAINWAVNDYTWGNAAFLDALAAANIPVIACFHNVPTWATSDGSTDLGKLQSMYNANMGAIAAAFVTHWPNTIAVEWGNELNIADPTGTTLGTYVPQLQAIYNAVHPTGAKVLTASIAPDYYDNMYAWFSALYTNGAKGYFDALGVHPYPGPEIWSGDLSSLNVSFVPQAARQARDANSDTVPLWVTEYGVNTAAGFSLDQQNAALQMLDAMWRRQPDVQAQIIHMLNEAPTSTYDFGIVSMSGTIRPAFTTTRNLWGSYSPPGYFDGDAGGVWTGVARQSTSFASLVHLQDALGFEEVYGPDQPLTAGDVPVLENGLCRLRFDTVNTLGWLVDVWSAGGWVEQGKLLVARNGDQGHAVENTLYSASVLEWTPDRTVVQAIVKTTLDADSRERVVLTLQRGWAGPRVELYGPPRTSGLFLGLDLRFLLFGADVNDSVLKIDTGGGVCVSTAGTGSSLLPAVTLGANSFTGENEVAVLREGGTGMQANIAAIQASAGMFIGTDVLGYPTTKNALVASAFPGYASFRLGFVAQQSDQILEAESLTLGSGWSSVTDASASAGNAAQTTQISDSGTITRPSWLSSHLGKYRVMVRASSTVVGAGSLKAVTGATTGATVTISGGSGYAWYDLGDIVADGGTLTLHGWLGSAGTLKIDRVEAYLLEDRTDPNAAYLGARDLGQASLVDVRQQVRRVNRGS